MKTAYAITAVLALFLVSACGPTVNAPADMEAIRNLNAGYEEAYNSRDLDWFSSTYYADDAVRLPPNRMMLSGKETIVADYQATFDQYNPTQVSLPVEEVTSSGDMAVARGTYYWTGTPVASGLSQITEEGKWIAVYNRQDDGSWKCIQGIFNSDQPAAGATADGADEEALLQILRDWGNAFLNKDRAALDNILAADFVSSGDQGIRNKRQYMTSAMSSALKFESMSINNMQAMVFGDAAVVHGSDTVKGTERGEDISGQYRWTVVFERRDGRWQCVTDYGGKVE